MRPHMPAEARTDTGGTSPLWARSSLLAIGLIGSFALALMLTIFFQGRTHILQATRPWLASLGVLGLIFAGWHLSFFLRLLRRKGGIPGGAFRPLVVWLGGLALIGIGMSGAVYLSDDFNHSFTVDPEFRGVFAVLVVAILYATTQLERGILASGDGQFSLAALVEAAGEKWELATVAAVTAIGVLLANSYVTVIGDDYARYWTIADSIMSGHGYPASEVSNVYQAGGMASYLVDLPGLPLLMVLSFSLLGHNALAAMAPALAASSLFAVAAYLAYRETTGRLTLSYAGAVALAMFPLLTFYVIRSGEPDGMFLTLLMALAFLGARADNHPQSIWGWAAFGAVAGYTALTRPEGIMYAGVAFFTLLFRHWSNKRYWLGASIAGAMAGAFSLVMITTFGLLWPASFAGTVAPQNITQNLKGFAGTAFPKYAEALGLPEPLLALLGIAMLLLYLVGSWQLARRKPQLLFLALLPILNLVAFLMVSPNLTRPQQPYDFFRRAGYLMPYFALVATYGLGFIVRAVYTNVRRKLVFFVMMALCLVVVGYEAKLLSRPEAVYEGGTQILTSGLYLLTTDMVANPIDIPVMPFEWDGKAMVVSPSFDYLAFRTRLNAHFAPMDLHGYIWAMGYTSSAVAIFLVGLFYAAAGTAVHLYARTPRGRLKD